MATSHQNQHRAKRRRVYRVALADTSDIEQLAQGASARAGLYFPAPDRLAALLAGFVDVHLQQHLRQGAASGCEGSVQGTLSPAAHKETRQAKT